jgi:hypothetical protein
MKYIRVLLSIVGMIYGARVSPSQIKVLAIVTLP